MYLQERFAMDIGMKIRKVQESLLDQSRRNPSGAVGIMQVIPKYAAANPINIPSVNTADTNIHAGVKMSRNIDDKYFNDPKIDAMNKTLFVLASYNAGPNRIARLRKEAPDMGLDPNVWFGNVELVAAKDIGQETVTYVANIYKYYVAYKLALADKQAKQQAAGLPAKWVTGTCMSVFVTSLRKMRECGKPCGGSCGRMARTITRRRLQCFSPARSSSRMRSCLLRVTPARLLVLRSCRFALM